MYMPSENNLTMFLFTTRWIKVNVLLVVILLVAIAQFFTLHIPTTNSELQSVLKISNVSRRNNYVKSTRTKVELQRYMHLSTYKGKPVEYTYDTIDYNRTDVWKLNYENFNISAPLFASGISRELFYRNVNNRNFIGSRPRETLKGEIYLIRNGTYIMSIDCGYKSDYNKLLERRVVYLSKWYHKAVVFYSPESWNFQHFLDGALPKLVQSLEILRDPEIKLLFPRPPRDRSIVEMLDRLNVSRDRIIYPRAREFGADYLYFTCITPPIHPALWQSARRLLGAPEILAGPLKNAFILFVTRRGCYNCARKVLNENEIISMLTKRYGDLLKIFKGSMSLDGVIEMFGNARVVIGAHGGGMYNINFAPINTTVIEFAPTFSDGRIDAASKDIIWSQASILGQVYWRICSAPLPGTSGDMVVDVKELKDILNATDKQLQL